MMSLLSSFTSARSSAAMMVTTVDRFRGTFAAIPVTSRSWTIFFIVGTIVVIAALRVILDTVVLRFESFARALSTATTFAI